MSLDKLTKIATSLAQQIDNNESFLTSVVADKLSQATELYPQDSTIISIASVVNKLSDKNMLITRGQLRDLYNKFYARNTKFAEVCGEELGEQVKLMTPKVATQIEDTVVKTDHLGDQVLSNALQSVFDKNAPLKMYAKDLADKAKKSVADTLDTWNISASSVEVSDGNEKFIIVKADYETPKGLTSFYIPVEIINNKLASANVFVGNSGPQDLNNRNIKDYVTSFAGEKLKLAGSNILEAITKAASEDREISDVELAIARMNSNRKEKQEFFANQILDQKVESEVKEIQLPKYSEFSHLEDKFTSPYGVASFNFGEEKVKIGRDLIARNLSSFGFKNPQITVTDSKDNTIFYAVALDSGRVAFTVPVKVQDNRVNSPEVMLCRGSVNAFNANTIKNLYANNVTDYKAAAVASPHYGLKSSDLVDAVRQAVSEHNLAKAEDALNVLAESGDAVAYATGFKVYASGLKGEEDGNDITKHPMYNAGDFYTTSSSTLPISKQTGLPINKIYIDENGNHRPLYRRAMQDSYQGAFFMNYKIFG